MVNIEKFLLNFMGKIEFPQEAQSVFLKQYESICKEPGYKERVQTCIDRFMEQKTEIAFEGVDQLAKDMGEHSYTMSMLLLLLCAKPLLERYKEKELSEELFFETMKDLTYKLFECWHIYGFWGTFVRSWYPGFYQVARFTLGRMQYEYSEFELDKFELNGFTVKKGDKVINMHIPSCGSFTKEKRLDSYKKAYEFYQKDFGGKPIPMVCSSWLLYPEHKEFLPEHLNIRGFMEDFSYIAGESEDKFDDAWRVFGSDFKKAPKDWPRKTTLQKAYAEHLEKGGKSGSGYGIFLFDGEKIIQ